MMSLRSYIRAAAIANLFRKEMGFGDVTLTFCDNEVRFRWTSRIHGTLWAWERVSPIVFIDDAAGLQKVVAKSLAEDLKSKLREKGVTD